MLIDFDSQNEALKGEVKHYLTFNVKKDLKEAMKHFYEKLREAENSKDIKYIFITHLDEA